MAAARTSKAETTGRPSSLDEEPRPARHSSATARSSNEASDDESSLTSRSGSDDVSASSCAVTYACLSLLAADMHIWPDRVLKVMMDKYITVLFHPHLCRLSKAFVQKDCMICKRQDRTVV